MIFVHSGWNRPSVVASKNQSWQSQVLFIIIYFIVTLTYSEVFFSLNCSIHCFSFQKYPPHVIPWDSVEIVHFFDVWLHCTRHNAVHLSCNTATVIKGQEGIEVSGMCRATYRIVSDLIAELHISIVFSPSGHAVKAHPSHSFLSFLTCRGSTSCREQLEQDQQKRHFCEHVIVQPFHLWDWTLDTNLVL